MSLEGRASGWERHDAAEPVAGERELRPSRRPGVVAEGTLACPRCDAPVALSGGRAGLGVRIACPFCEHASSVRDFLSLAVPTRPARVVITVRQPAGARRRAPR